MNAATLMDRVFDLYKPAFKVHIGFAVIMRILSVILSFTGIILMVMGVGVNEFIGIGYGMTTAVVAMLVTILPLYVIWVYLSQAGHIFIAKQVFYGETIELPFADTIRATFRVMAAVLAQLILSIPWLLMLGVIIYSMVAQITIVYVFLINLAMWQIFVVLFSIAFLYLVYANIFALSIPVAIFERRLFFATVTRSLQLMQGDFWKILGLRVLWFVLVYLFTISAQGLVVTAIGLFTAIGGGVFDTVAMAELWMNTNNTQVLIGLLAGVVLAPLEGIMTALIYFNQKIKKEGLDIEIGLTQLSWQNGQNGQNRQICQQEINQKKEWL